MHVNKKFVQKNKGHATNVSLSEQSAVRVLLSYSIVLQKGVVRILCLGTLLCEVLRTDGFDSVAASLLSGLAGMQECLFSADISTARGEIN